MVSLENISCSYHTKKVIHKVNFCVQKGEIVSILGANGSGKSTLLKAIVGLLAYQGSLHVNQKEIKNLHVKTRAALMAYVPQSSVIPFDFTVLEIVLMGRFHTSSFGLGYKKEDLRYAYESLEKIGIQKFSNKIFRELSGGERQLVLLARALAQNSELIVLDEPVTGLDLGNQMRLLELLLSLSKEGKTIIQTTHYPDHALKISNKVAWLHEGKLLAFGIPKEVITKERIKQIYRVETEFITCKGKETFMLPLNFIQKGE